MVLSRKGKFLSGIRKSAPINSDGSEPAPKVFDWVDAVIDSLIYASGFFIGSLVTGIADGGLSILDFGIATLLFSGSFVTFLRIKRNIPKEVREPL